MRIGVLTGGGDCPGLNAVIRAVVRKGVKAYGYEFIGFRDGWRGPLEGLTIKLDIPATRGILPRGGTILGSSRTNPFKIDGGVEKIKSPALRTPVLVDLVHGGLQRARQQHIHARTAARNFSLLVHLRVHDIEQGHHLYDIALGDCHEDPRKELGKMPCGASCYDHVNDLVWNVDTEGIKEGIKVRRWRHPWTTPLVSSSSATQEAAAVTAASTSPVQAAMRAILAASASTTRAFS